MPMAAAISMAVFFGLCSFLHSRPLWRFMFFSKRSFNALSSSSRCFGDNSFLLRFMLFLFFLQAPGLKSLNHQLIADKSSFGFSLSRFKDSLSEALGRALPHAQSLSSGGRNTAGA